VVKFGSSNQHIECPAHGVGAIDAPHTLAAWMTWYDTSAIESGLTVNNAAAGAGANAAIQMGLRGTTMNVAEAGGTVVVDSSQTPTVNQWYHVAFTTDGTANAIYVDAVEKATSSYGLQSGTASAIRVATYNGEGDDHRGSVAAPMVWNRQLSASEIRAVYAAQQSFLLMTRPALYATSGGMFPFTMRGGGSGGMVTMAGI